MDTVCIWVLVVVQFCFSDLLMCRNGPVLYETLLRGSTFYSDIGSTPATQSGHGLSNISDEKGVVDCKRGVTDQRVIALHMHIACPS